MGLSNIKKIIQISFSHSYSSPLNKMYLGIIFHESKTLNDAIPKAVERKRTTQRCQPRDDLLHEVQTWWTKKKEKNHKMSGGGHDNRPADRSTTRENIYTNSNPLLTLNTLGNKIIMSVIMCCMQQRCNKLLILNSKTHTHSCIHVFIKNVRLIISNGMR